MSKDGSKRGESGADYAQVDWNELEEPLKKPWTRFKPCLKGYLEVEGRWENRFRLSVEYVEGEERLKIVCTKNKTKFRSFVHLEIRVISPNKILDALESFSSQYEVFSYEV